ncbi:ABC transporter permease [Alkalihalobacillus oceani]|uniref:ABC transporter permease n=1 Tax=Halalkalibacter oceani TaxID=1653776 RepID=A0A9X2IPA7_9BACI|nr:ABC transporter permease [Halalkalibacter oceani]MCM3715849.1 ABC transporter permease [Halalkalibacter oceani]
MKSVFLLQWQRFKRAPVLVLFFFGLTLLFVFFLAGFRSESELTVYTYGDETLTVEERDGWLEKLNESGALRFVWVEEEEARHAVATGMVSLALRLMKDDYRLLVATDEQTHYVVDSYVNQVFTEELRIRQLEASERADIRSEVERFLAEPVLTVSSTSLAGADGVFLDEERLHVLFGMTLFFSIYTIMFSLMNVAEEKREGTWNRLIVSPLRKWQVYTGHLLYCFIIGILQIVAVFFIFYYLLDFELGNRFGTMLIVIGCYVFAIVALGMLLIGLVRTSQQLQAVIPITSTAIAMLGGAFWPIEIVTNEVMLLLAQAMPIFYAMEGLKGASLYQYGVGEIATPLSFLLLIGVICMGIGINLMERK